MPLNDFENKKKLMFEYHFETKTPVSYNLDENIFFFKELMKGSSDVVYREFVTGGIDGKSMFLFYIDGMADKAQLNQFVLSPLMLISRQSKPDFNEIKNRLYDFIKASTVTTGDLKESGTLEEMLKAVLAGDAALLLDGSNKGLILSVRSFPGRGVAEPSSETVIRGPRDGFTETIRFNTALVRRRIRDPRFKISQKQIGERSKTDIAIVYIEDIANKEIVDEVNKRISKIKIDGIIDSGYVQQFIEEKKSMFFPTVQTTERPDAVAAAVYEGRVAILVDNSPFALIVPGTLDVFFQSPEDYYVRPMVATFMRFIRNAAVILSAVSPALYVAITSFHPGIIPSSLALSIASTREGVPFPAFIEALIMDLTLELLLEAGVRLPRPIGSTIGIVGGLIIGQAAVSAGIVSPIMVIVVAITAVSSFALPSFEISSAFRFSRILFIIGASIYGLYGMILVLLFILIHLSELKSFTVSYLSPFAPLRLNDLKDSVFIKLPVMFMKRRPEKLEPIDNIRQEDEDNDKGQ